MIHDLKRRSAQAVEQYHAILDEEDRQAASPARQTAPSARPYSLVILGQLLLEASLTPVERKRLAKTPGLSVLIESPTAEWVRPLHRAIGYVGPWVHHEMRDGTPRNRRKPDDGADEIAETMARGARVCIVCHAPSAHLHRSFLGAVDMHVRVRPPSIELVREAIRQVTGKPPRNGPATVAGLDFTDLVAAIRGNSAARCVARIEAAVRMRSAGSQHLRNVPDVENARGYGAAGEWAAQLVADLKDGSDAAWRDAEKSAIFYGPPGTGKTSLAHIVAKSANLSLVETSVAAWFEGSSYLERVLGRLQEAFREARAKAPCVLFLDECEAFPSRDLNDDRNASYYGPLQAAYLKELEETAAEGSRVVLIAATNHIAKLDPAVLRPGRLGRSIYVGPPDRTALADIIRQHLGDDLPGADLSGVAVLGIGGTGAEAVAWVRGARRRARVAARAMELDDLVREVAPPDERSDAARWRCACHEAGHATVAHHGGEAVQRVSIVPRGRAGGHTLTVAGDEGPTMTPSILETVVAATLGGRAAEEAMGLGLSTGAHDDLRVATGLAAAARVSFGMSGSLVHRAPSDRAAALCETDPILREEVCADLARAYSVALATVTRHRSFVEALARLLLEVRVVERVDFLALAEAHDRALAAEGGPDHG
ncbi:AAA family ATPase [Methylobacterium sp. 285MFTsu5.1]|uniref:AAA family ATPase n=1 Tax=Methylobacterium sp. 285MFTsu5.1 TaxID=1172187 RepID=UPI00037A22DB|nr:AAA family ATPase [Methylobacterium sp. 285MFTsu5.1]